MPLSQTGGLIGVALCVVGGFIVACLPFKNVAVILGLCAIRNSILVNIVSLGRVPEYSSTTTLTFRLPPAWARREEAETERPVLSNRTQRMQWTTIFCYGIGPLFIARPPAPKSARDLCRRACVNP